MQALIDDFATTHSTVNIKRIREKTKSISKELIIRREFIESSGKKWFNEQNYIVKDHT